MIRRLLCGVLASSVLGMSLLGVVAGPAAAATDESAGFPPGVQVYQNGLFPWLTGVTSDRPGISPIAWEANWENVDEAKSWIRPAGPPVFNGRSVTMTFNWGGATNFDFDGTYALQSAQGGHYYTRMSLVCLTDGVVGGWQRPPVGNVRSHDLGQTPGMFEVLEPSGTVTKTFNCPLDDRYGSSQAVAIFSGLSTPGYFDLQDTRYPETSFHGFRPGWKAGAFVRADPVCHNPVTSKSAPVIADMGCPEGAYLVGAQLTAQLGGDRLGSMIIKPTSLYPGCEGFVCEVTLSVDGIPCGPPETDPPPAWYAAHKVRCAAFQDLPPDRVKCSYRRKGLSPSPLAMAPMSQLPDDYDIQMEECNKRFGAGAPPVDAPPTEGDISIEEAARRVAEAVKAVGDKVAGLGGKLGELLGEGKAQTGKLGEIASKLDGILGSMGGGGDGGPGIGSFPGVPSAVIPQPLDIGTKISDWGRFGECFRITPASTCGGGPMIDMGFYQWRPFSFCGDLSGLHKARDIIGAGMIVITQGGILRLFMSALGVSVSIAMMPAGGVAAESKQAGK